jgi:toxin ParE1/3/4
LARARILRSAVKDLDEIWLYIARDSIDAAEKMIQRIEEASEKLASMPGMGQKRDDLQPGIRSYPVGRYLIFYRGHSWRDRGASRLSRREEIPRPLSVGRR